MSGKKDDMPSHHGVKIAAQNKDYPNDTIRFLYERASLRNFADKDIPDDVLYTILGSGIHAATGGNLQPFSIIKIRDKSKNSKLAKMCHQEFIGKAPVNLMFCIDWHRLERWAHLEDAPYTAEQSFRHFWISFQDTIIAAQNICTAADALGLGSVYIGTVMDLIPEIIKMLKLPDKVLPVVLLCLGYPKEKPSVRRKLPLETIVHNEKYTDLDDKTLLDAFESKYSGTKIAITDDRLEMIKAVCEKTHSPKFAEKCLERINEAGYINVAQRYFGLHYRADIMPQGNEEFLDIIKKAGFGWFEKWQADPGR